MRKITIAIDYELERALAEATRLLDLPESASDSERLRAYAQRGYEEALAAELDANRLAASWREGLFAVRRPGASSTTLGVGSSMLGLTLPSRIAATS